MPKKAAPECTHREAVKSLARNKLTREQRRAEQRHLEDCDDCRGVFRRLTGDSYPNVRAYTIVDRIGDGGFGIVYKAVHHAKKRTEALKVLYGESHEREAYFENEVKLVARLQHPNIATLYEAHLSTPPMYFCMEFVEGEPFDQFIRDSDASLAERIGIVRTVALAIHYAHTQGVVHRDIKPQNIIIDESRQPRIVDFGIAKLLGLRELDPNAETSPASPDGPIGTMGYMSPEQAEHRNVDGRADVYSLGALLFYAVTGEAPRRLKAVRDLTAHLRRRRVTRSEDLAAILRRCTADRPADRYDSCAEFVNDLDNYLVGRPTLAGTDNSFTYRVRRVSSYVMRNHPLAVGSSVVLATALLLILTVSGLTARIFVPGGARDHVALIGFMPSTLDALRSGRIGGDLPGLSLHNRKSWRLLQARLMRKLAAADVRVLVWDYFYPDHQPAYDPAFVQAVHALNAPVIVGARLDGNAEPIMSPEIRRAVHGFGILYALNPKSRRGEHEPLLSLQRGFEPPVPSLAIAALAAHRFPRCAPYLSVERNSLHLRYRKRQSVDGEPRWQSETSVIPLIGVHTDTGSQWTRPGDKLAYARFKAWPFEEDAARTIAFEDVLTAEPEQLRGWFAGRVVIVGNMSGLADRHEIPGGSTAYGCQIYMQIIESLIRESYLTPLPQPAITMRALFWCFVVAIAVSRIRRLPHGLSLGRAFPGGLAAALLGLVFAAYVATRVHDPVLLELGIILSALLVTGGPMFVAVLARDRQVRLSPDLTGPVVTTPDSTTIAAARLYPSPAVEIEGVSTVPRI